MNDSASPKGLKDEWSLLIHSFLNEDENATLRLDTVSAEVKSSDQLKLVRKDLSARRKKINQSIEKIKIKMEQLQAVIENLELVGSDVTGLLKEIDYLSHEGSRLSEELLAIDQKIKKAHQLQENIDRRFEFEAKI